MYDLLTSYSTRAICTSGNGIEKYPRRDEQVLNRSRRCQPKPLLLARPSRGPVEPGRRCIPAVYHAANLVPCGIHVQAASQNQMATESHTAGRVLICAAQGFGRLQANAAKRRTRVVAVAYSHVKQGPCPILK
jgi:hypothetical protein